MLIVVLVLRTVRLVKKSKVCRTKNAFIILPRPQTAKWKEKKRADEWEAFWHICLLQINFRAFTRAHCVYLRRRNIITQAHRRNERVYTDVRAAARS